MSWKPLVEERLVTTGYQLLDTYRCVICGKIDYADAKNAARSQTFKCRCAGGCDGVRKASVDESGKVPASVPKK